MRVTAIVSDLDDTLLNDEIALSDFTIQTLREAKRRGIRFIAASGRALSSMRGYVDQVGAGDPYIACNGAQLVASDHRPMETLVMPASLAREIVAFLEGRGFYVQAYAGDRFFYRRECERSLAYARVSGMQGEAVGDLSAFLTFDTPKLLAIHEPEAVAAAYAETVERFAGRAVFTISKPIFLEAQPPHATKGEGLERLARRVGLELATTLAFGDSLNDLSMLRAAGIGVAVGNARPEVRDAARYVCDTNDHDGVARFIRAHVLEEAEA